MRRILKLQNCENVRRVVFSLGWMESLSLWDKDNKGLKLSFFAYVIASHRWRDSSSGSVIRRMLACRVPPPFVIAL